MPIAFPASVAPAKVEARPVWANAQYDNPVTLGTETQVLGGFRWEIDIFMQPMPRAAAEDFGEFIQAMEGGAETFTFDITLWVPGWSPAPGARTFRLATNNTGFNASVAKEHGFQFMAVEDV